jgi:hypothetical protein
LVGYPACRITGKMKLSQNRKLKYNRLWQTIVLRLGTFAEF